ncbi:hypothetical protein [Marinobacter nanhaiticus]|uniref:hypothetical protein n=1 Tax=Marinobacter nanhaiticus TaxID=1305740 RepID=UPI0002CA00BB|nr:hypothetical protein [Marinobacter nanhaiticus]
MLRPLSLCLLAISCSWTATASAQENEIITIDGAMIRGDQEMPTVMYLVPWQPPAIEALEQPTERLMLERTFVPLERAQFRRMLDYHDRFVAQFEEGDSEEVE